MLNDTSLPEESPCLLGRTDMTYDEFVALGAPKLPIGYTYRLTYVGDGYSILEIVEKYTTFFFGKTKYLPIISCGYNTNMWTPANVAVSLYKDWQREVRAREQSNIRVMER